MFAVFIIQTISDGFWCCEVAVMCLNSVLTNLACDFDSRTMSMKKNILPSIQLSPLEDLFNCIHVLQAAAKGPSTPLGLYIQPKSKHELQHSNSSYG